MRPPPRQLHTQAPLRERCCINLKLYIETIKALRLKGSPFAARKLRPRSGQNASVSSVPLRGADAGWTRLSQDLIRH